MTMEPIPGAVASTEGLGQDLEHAEVARLDDGEAWSFCRTVMSDGRNIRQWHPEEGYEMQSARMDAQAARRGDQLMAMVRALVAAERERWQKAATAALEVLDDLPEWSGAGLACKLLREAQRPNVELT